MTDVAWIIAGVGLAVLVVGLVLVMGGRRLRLRLGLGEGRTVALDNVTLTSWRLLLTGRPDRLVKSGGMVIAEEWKSSRLPRAWHRAQLGCYFLLLEEETGVRPTHGFLVGDDTRHRVENTAELRAFVLEVAGQIRAARARIRQEIAVNPVPGQCRRCGVREHCSQARL